MRRRSLYGVMILAIFAFLPAMVSAQDPGSDASTRTDDSGFELQQNYPNPFNPTTRIPFTLAPELFEASQDGTVTVTMRIFNVLQQLVAYPTAMGHPDGNGVEVNGLTYYTPGQKEAFWDGRDINGRQVASSIYYLQMIVGNHRQIIKMIVTK